MIEWVALIAVGVVAFGVGYGVGRMHGQEDDANQIMMLTERLTASDDRLSRTVAENTKTRSIKER